MGQRTTDYNPADVSVIIGSHIVSGFADGTFIGIERNNDAFTRVAGADGENARSKSNDKSGRLTLTLLQTSQSNEVLSGFAAADEASNGGTFPFLIKDNNGNSLYAAEVSWVVKYPAVEYGKEISNREWVIETGELIPFVGGNPSLA